MEARPSLWIIAAVLAGCHGTPARLVDSGAEGPVAQATSPRVVLGPVRTFGEEGELPTGLLSRGPDHLFAITDRAIYLLDLEGRVINRQALPAGPEGLPAVVTSARADEVGLGLGLSWGGSPLLPAGGYLALSDGQGALEPALMTRLAPPGSALRGDWDGEAHQLVWLEPDGSDLELRWAAVPRGASPAGGVLEAGISPGENSGDWLVGPDGGRSYCAVNEAGQATLRRYLATGDAGQLIISSPGERAIGRCRLASSGRSLAAAWIRRPASGQALDGGSPAVDLGLGALTFDRPVVQLLDPAGQLLDAPRRLSLVEGTVRLESLAWDGHRYLALLDAAGVRGGRLILAVFDETGRLLFRDLLLPLEYDPGLLEAGRLLVTPNAYYLLYSTRRPWDEGICRIVRFFLES